MYKYLRLVVLIGLAAFSAGKANAQTEDDSLVQFSGLVLTSDSLMGLTDVNIRIKGSYFGAVSNDLGIFSLVTRKGDTVLFTSVGYKPKTYVVPSNLNNQRYSMIITMTSDTFMLDTVIVRPFMSKELLPHYFVTVDVPEDEEILIARRNLEAEFLKQRAAEMGADGPENQKMTLRQEAAKYYYSGQMPPQNILNPIAWAQFIKAWRNGDFKNKKKKK